MTESESQIGSLLKQARETAGLSQVAVAEKLGVDSMTVSRWERGKHRVPGSALLALAALYRIEPAALGYVDTPDETPDSDPWEPNPALAGIIPRRAYDVAIGYCRRLAAAGLPRAEIEEAERLLIDPAYAKLNRRIKREFTEEEQIEMIDATWSIMREALSWRGLRA